MGVGRYNKNRVQQNHGGQYPFFIVSTNPPYHLFKGKKMAEIKMMYVLQYFCYTLTGIAPFIIKEWQSVVLFSLLVIYWIQRTYFSIRKSRQEERGRELSLKEKEFDVNKKIDEEI